MTEIEKVEIELAFAKKKVEALQTFLEWMKSEEHINDRVIEIEMQRAKRRNSCSEKND